MTDSTSGQSETVTAPPEHPFFVQGQGFVPASMLAIGNSIVTRAGPALMITNIAEQDQDGGYAVYNFVVPGDHTYFVGTLGNGVWVHNPVDCNKVANTVHPVTNVTYDADGYPIFDSKFTTALPSDKIGPTVSDDAQMGYATRQVREHLKANPGDKAGFTPNQLAAIKSGRAKIPGYTWHHHQNGVDMQLIDEWTHSKTGHNGGRQATGGRP